MTRTLFALVMVGAALLAGAQQNGRMERIFGAINDRIAIQTDAWFEDGEFPRAIQLLRFQNGMLPNDYDVATNLGWLLESTDQYDEALATYVRYKNDNVKDPDATFPEANFYYMKRLYAKVPALLEPSLPKKPHGNSYRILAHSYERMQMFADSLRVWDEYIKMNPGDDAAKNNRNRVAGKLKGNGKT